MGHDVSPRRMFLAVGIVVLIVGMIFLLVPQREVSVTILDPKFRLLSANLSHGHLHKLYHNGPVMGRVAELLHRAGCKFGDAPLMGLTTNVSDALVLRFTGDFPPNALAGVQAESVDDSGTTNRLWCIAGYNAESTPSEYGKIWALNRPRTNKIRIRLVSANGQTNFAEIHLQPD